jgi:peptidoglycan/xylan/chitin deacetylase (PgdA/CDA1 family)
VEKKLELSNEDSKIKIQKKEENTTINYQAVDKTIDSNKPIIALTFDDGPSKYTKPIIDLLKQYNSNATFFVLGNKVKIYKETIIESINLGNEIGNHSYNHKWLSRLKVEELKEQINKTQNILKEEVNYTPILLRPTYGSVNKKIRNNTNLEIVLWNVDTLDWKIKSSKKIVERALSQIKDRSIILMHDTHERTYEALKIMIPKLIDEGYQFVTISELKKINKLSNMEDR